jgi:hypothetical protein
MELSTGITPEVYKLLEEADWENLYPLMLGYAIKRARLYYQVAPKDILPSGQSIEDAVEYVITAAFDGTRHWEPKEVPLHVWLLKQIDSVLSWWANLKENKEISYSEQENTLEEEKGKDNSSGNLEQEVVRKSIGTSFEDNLIRKEDSAEFVNALFEEISDDEEVMILYFAIIEANDPKPQALAKQLGITETDMYNRRRRLKRNVEKVFTKLGRITHAEA